MTTTNPKDILKLIASQGKSFHLAESSDIPSAVRALLLNDTSSLTTFILTLYIPRIIQYLHITSDFMSS